MNVNFGVRKAITESINKFHPGYFAVVMATGIVSVACHQQGMKVIPMLFLRFNVAVYAAVWVFTLARYLFSHSRLQDDLADYNHAPGFFATVAGTCILGTQFVVFAGDYGTAAVLWFAGFILWFVLIYAFLAGLIAQRDKPGLTDRINGEWLLIVVSTQSVSILGALTAASMPAAKETFLFMSLCMFLIGSMLYMIVITAILYRMIFIGFMPADMAPSCWINMGAAAISTLAGTTLIIESYRWSFLSSQVTVLAGGSLFFWTAGSLWIPLLIILGVWSHIYRRAPLVQASRYWSLVFPLGMYSACSFQLADVTGLSFLLTVSRIFRYAALLAWMVTLIAVVCLGIRFIGRYMARH